MYTVFTVNGKKNFNPRSPWGERRRENPGAEHLHLFQSTLPVGGATRSRRFPTGTMRISIHAPRGGSDLLAAEGSVRVCYNFNPRSPWGERRRSICPNKKTFLFQSTLPVGGATLPTNEEYLGYVISIHAPRGGSDILKPHSLHIVENISIHAPRGGSDFSKAKGAALVDRISIHAPRGGSDLLGRIIQVSVPVISIHAPRGGSDAISYNQAVATAVFQSTLPVGGATPHISDVTKVAYDFNPRSPWGERQQRCTNFRLHLWQRHLSFCARPRKSRTKPV